MNKEIIEDIKTVLEFYDALGFERLPISYGLKSLASGKSPRRQVSSFKLKDKENAEQNSSPVTRRPSHEKVEALRTLREEIGDCQRCKLSKGRKNIVFGEGSVDAEIMFIGEGPGKEEDLQARPFVGDAGRLLTKLIEKMGFKRESVYIGNIVKCRPPFNRDPEEDEIVSCISFIQRQIEIISPKVLVALGRISAQTLIGAKIPISKLRGKFHQYNNMPLMPTFHPAYLLRNPKDKWLVWEDVQKVLEALKR